MDGAHGNDEVDKGTHTALLPIRRWMLNWLWVYQYQTQTVYVQHQDKTPSFPPLGISDEGDSGDEY